MSFGHPSQHHHMLLGISKALASPKTPQHLKSHLKARLEGSNMAFGIPKKPAMKKRNLAAAPEQVGIDSDQMQDDAMGGPENYDDGDQTADALPTKSLVSKAKPGMLQKHKPMGNPLYHGTKNMHGQKQPMKGKLVKKASKGKRNPLLGVL